MPIGWSPPARHKSLFFFIIILLFIFFFFLLFMLVFSLVTRLRCTLFIFPPPVVGYYIPMAFSPNRRFRSPLSHNNRTTTSRVLDTMCDLCFPLFTGGPVIPPTRSQNIKRNIRHTIMIYNRSFYVYIYILYTHDLYDAGERGHLYRVPASRYNIMS